MEKLLLPSSFKTEETGRENEGLIIIEPCYHGYGTTLGNALRRVLLSSLPGAAVTAVKIRGVSHEFSTLEHVREDIVELILNLKQLRLRVFSPETVKLTLEARGEGEITASQIAVTSDVEIVNPDLHLAALTHKNAKLEMEIFVSRGRGYVNVEEKDRKKMDFGVIAIDSIFTPVLNVGYQVDLVRVGEITNFEKLTLTVETDGTITPIKAVIQATEILLDHFNLILQEFGGGVEIAKEIAALSEGKQIEEMSPSGRSPEGRKETKNEEKEEVKDEPEKAAAPAKRGRKKGSGKKK